MIDTHSHLFSEDFDNDRNEVLENAFDSGVKVILMPAIEPKTFDKVIETAELDHRLYCSMGVHPHNAQEYNQEVEETIISNLANPKVKAIGEIGLDYYYDFAPKEIQKEVFIQQIRLAKKFNLPVIVHNRESDIDLMQILRQEQSTELTGVLHCFSGDTKMMQEAIEMGFNVSFTGNITFKKAHDLREVVKNAPIEHIMLETDAPYLAPVPMRGKRNEPKYLIKIAEKIAEIKSLNINEVIEMTSNNAKKLFNLLSLTLFFVLTFLLTNNQLAYSKDEDTQDEEIIDDGNPYPKLIGIGFTSGLNTIVDTYLPEGQDISYDGLFAMGGSITGYPLDFLFLQATYLNWTNIKPYEDTKVLPKYLDPEKGQLYEFSFGVIPNPHSKMNFFVLSGVSFYHREYTQYDWITDPNGIKLYLSDDKMGILAGLGFIANIPIQGAGVFTINAEWRLNFLTEHSTLPVNPRLAPTDPNYSKSTEFSTFFSVPRATILWYPPFSEWF